MNFVAAVLLIGLGNPHDAFWMLLAMIEGYYFRHLFEPGVPLLPLRIFQFSSIVQEHLPKLSRHLQAENFSVNIFAHQCVMTVFAYSLEPDFLLHVWDIFFLMGWKALFRIGVGILVSLEDKLLEVGTEDISHFLHNCKQHYTPGAEVTTVLSGLMRFKISAAALYNIQCEFQFNRWSALLHGVRHEKFDEPLPTGFSFAPDDAGIKIDLNAFSTGNLPPWRIGDRLPLCGGDSRLPFPKTDKPLLLSMIDLRRLRMKLDEYDLQTQDDIAQLRTRLTDVDKQFEAVSRSAANFRAELDSLVVERDECYDFKMALMSAVQVAVSTSFESKRNQSEHEGKLAGHINDTTVRQIVDKMRHVERNFYELNRRCQSKFAELYPLEYSAEELHETKSKLTHQLSDFLNEYNLSRRKLIEGGIREMLDTATEMGVPVLA